MDAKAPVLPSTTTHPSVQAQVGDGFYIQRALPVEGRGPAFLDPFLLLDHAGPTTFGPSTKARGVGPHPHKGFETVTLVYQGDLRHRDSAGNTGQLGVGDVQWMTAGAGIVHEELHGPTLTQQGGTLEMVQLWINLPARDKSVAPHYRDLRAQSFPTIPLTEAGTNYVRLVAGVWEGYTGPAHTYTPLTLADLYLEPGLETKISLDRKWHTGLYVLRGGVSVNGESVAEHGLATVRDEGEVTVKAFAESHLLLLSGLPIAEPIAISGPFVMNTEDEVRTARREFADGLYGKL